MNQKPSQLDDEDNDPITDLDSLSLMPDLTHEMDDLHVYFLEERIVALVVNHTLLITG